MFHYSSYWHTWSRVLVSPPEMPSDYFEVNLTPIHHVHYSDQRRSGWEGEVTPIVIRRHCTPRRSGDLDVPRLPAAILDLMLENLDSALVTRLLTEDFVPQIDWVKFNKHCNAGCELALCLKEVVPHDG